MTDDLLDSLIYSTRYAAGFVLKRYGRVLPFCVQFAPAEDPRVDFYFPREAQPRAPFEEQYTLAEARARRFAQKAETCALSFVTEITVDEQRYLVIQAETRSEVRQLRYPLRKTWLGWKLDKPEPQDGLLLGRLLAGQ